MTSWSCRPGDRDASIAGQQLFRLEFVPQGLRDWQIDVVGIALDLGGTDCARHNRGDARMAKRKLDGRRRQWHMVALADDVDSRHVFENCLRRWLIVIFCSRRSTGGQNPRVEWAANQQ